MNFDPLQSNNSIQFPTSKYTVEENESIFTVPKSDGRHKKKKHTHYDV